MASAKQAVKEARILVWLRQRPGLWRWHPCFVTLSCRSSGVGDGSLGWQDGFGLRFLTPSFDPAPVDCENQGRSFYGEHTCGVKTQGRNDVTTVD